MTGMELRRIDCLAEYLTVGFVGSMSALFTERGVPLLRGQNIKPYALDFSNLKYISNETHRKWRKSALSAGDVVIVRVGYPGTACVIPAGLGNLNAASLVIVRPDPKLLDSHYLAYVLNSPWGKSTVAGRLVGAAQQVFNTNTAAEMQIPAPDVTIQRRISSILSTYDSLIENNMRRIAILEEMARRIYQEWFVRFRFPGHEGVRMVESEMGLVPEGWKVMTLGEIVDEVVDYRGKTPAKLNGEWSSEGVLALSALNVKRGRLVNLEKSRFVSEELYKRWMKNPLRRGDILMTSEAPLGELFFLQTEDRFCLSQRIYGIRANRRVISPVILYLSLDSKGTQDELASRATGATVNGIRQSELRKVPIVVPPKAVQLAAEQALANVVALAAKLDTACTNLRQTRDFLLPKLLSGELDLSALPEPEAIAA